MVRHFKTFRKFLNPDRDLLLQRLADSYQGIGGTRASTVAGSDSETNHFGRWQATHIVMRCGGSADSFKCASIRGHFNLVVI
jgi:hypothetical protein